MGNVHLVHANRCHILHLLQPHTTNSDVAVPIQISPIR
jgi:hypothetical protein